MKKNRLFILGLASLMSLGLASCNGGSHNGEKIEHHKESYYESIDSNYDFYFFFNLLSGKNYNLRVSI